MQGQNAPGKILKKSVDKWGRLSYNNSRTEQNGCKTCERSSSGRAPPCQGGGSEFEPRRSLHVGSSHCGEPFFCLQFGRACGGRGFGGAGLSQGFTIQQAFQWHLFLAHFHANILFPDTRKTAVLIEWIGTGVVGMKKKGFAILPAFQLREQKASNPFALDRWICGEKDNFSVGPVGSQIGGEKLLGSRRIGSRAVLIKGILHKFEQLHIDGLPEGTVFFRLSFQFCKQNPCEFFSGICGDDLGGAREFQIPEIPAVELQKKRVVQIPLKVHPCNGELDCFGKIAL